MIIKNIGLISFLTLFTFSLSAQSVQKVYKIDGLLNRVAGSDTFYVINFWATWCKPCIEELPAFDSLSVVYTGSKVKVLLVCLNFSDEIKTKVNPFLKSKHIRSECVLLDEVNGNDFVNKIYKEWSGAIPATWFISGNQHYLIEKKLKLEDLKLRIKNFPSVE